MTSADQIRHLINAYSFTLDSGDLDGFAALFAKGEWVFDGGTPLVGQQAVREKLLTRVVIYPDGTPRTRHLSMNEDLFVDEAAGTATCRRYVTVIQQTEDLPLGVIYSGEYLDELARDGDGMWHYTRLSISRPFYGEFSCHILPSS
ncbi:nuclear transport factor 2 family protein [Ruegeria atlantica]|uniref:nuclear transport factor 2 family protein n=1 Tax=Ruegeria atlantica TaxID=81569 RepID=UPI00147C957A|nr:nuclear transport factor 2 family protein [Ruegeria atlantica]